MRFYFWILLGTAFCGCLEGALPSAQVSPSQRRLLFNSLPHQGIRELLAFSLLYPTSQESMVALGEAWRVVYPGRVASMNDLGRLASAAKDLIKMSGSVPTAAGDYGLEALALVEEASRGMGNRRLKGYRAMELSQVLALAPEEIDLGRALLLAEMEGESGCEQAVRSYEAALDWMALQIMNGLPAQASDQEKIAAINRYLFQTLHYRFPSYRKYAKQVDNYSLLGKVIEARQGVCLGVSLLFGCLAQRLNLPIVFITPPGHIFVRYEDSKSYRNIETTAGGIHIEDQKYLGLDLEKLPRRNNREVIGLAHLNAGSTFWHRGDYEKALDQYAKARKFMGDDPLLMCLTGFCRYLSGDVEGGKRLLTVAVTRSDPLINQAKSIVVDLLANKADADALKAIYTEIDKKRPEMEEYRKQLEDVVKRCPQFRAAWLQLGMTWLELQREDHALEALKNFHALDDSDTTVEYLLAELSHSRQDDLQAWKYLKNAEKLCAHKAKLPPSIKQLRTMLSASCACGDE